MKITIVGLGVVGGSFAMALQRAGGHEVYGVDSNEQTIQKALNQGLIVEGGADGSRFF